MKKSIMEEYLETILYLTRGQPARDGRAKTSDIAAEMEIKPPSVSEMLLKLKEEGLVDYRPHEGASLTAQGRVVATQMERKHQLLETFLVDILGVDAKRAHHEACEMEHHMSDDTVARLCAYLGHPRLCPDDHPIPRGKCCKKSPHTVPLTELSEGEKGVIKLVNADRSSCDSLTSLGFLPEVVLSIKRRLPSNSLLVSIKGCEIAIGRTIAEKIYVARGAA